ncbi:MAG: hypothetical protein JST63_14365 [Bacteroidetes bacterium]|nr:hypothetical protein [Bacteroidota bacterium]
MKNLICGMALLLTFSSCATTELITLSVTEPAPVTISSDIKRLVVLDRTGISEKRRPVDIMDKVFSLEGKDLDAEGARASTSGMIDVLSGNNRFEKVIKYPDVLARSSVAGIFPAPLSWQEITDICSKTNTDAVFSLEVFDTDSKINYTANPVSVNTPLGKVPAIEHVATMETRVKTGWRIYDALGRQLLDEYIIEKVLNFHGRGINPAAAAAALLERKDAVKQAGTLAGTQYALRIVPYSVRVSRDYYVRGSDNFKVARRKAQTGNWDGAAAIWQQETTSTNDKVAGRACYNMAIIGEINGNLEEATGWAQKAYEEYANKLALRYVKILERRKMDNAILKEQTAKK